ncbi:hypothetical protein C8T65DRAFT_693935, partial [Cerioporus squamosus]
MDAKVSLLPLTFLDGYVSKQQCKHAGHTLLSHVTKHEQEKAEHQLFSSNKQKVRLIVNTKVMLLEKKSKLHGFMSVTTVTTITGVTGNGLRTTYNERRYPFLTRKLRKRQTAKTAENRIDHPLLRRPGDAQNQTTNRGKPLPTLPLLYIPVTRPATPHPYSRGISSVIPFVENISSAYSSPSTLVQPGEPAFHRTPEWQEYRSSLTTSEGRPRAEDILIPAQPSPESSGADSDYPETSVERSSTAGLFYRRAQVAVHAIDTLQVIASNLEVLRQEDFAGEYREALERAHRYTAKVLQTLEHIPREV